MAEKYLIGFLVVSTLVLVVAARAQTQDSSMTNEQTITFPGMTNAVVSDADNDTTTEGKRTDQLEKDEGPVVIKGPELDNVTEEDQRRYLEIAEEVCERYKVLKMDINGEENKECEPIYIPQKAGGKVASIEEFPHMALVGWKKIKSEGYDWRCGGSLISDQYILTAAQCMYPVSDPVLVRAPPQAVQLGGTYVDEPGALVVPIATLIIHPKHKRPITYYDIALVKMETKVTFTNKVRPACLGVPPAVGESVIATGWGATTSKLQKQSRDLRCVLISMWDSQECMGIYIPFRRLPYGLQLDNQVCAGHKLAGRDTCQGDSGGPIQFQDGCAWRVVGITSFGRGCGSAGVPGVYALASKDFIIPIVFGASSINVTKNRRNDSKIITNQTNTNNNNHQTTGDNNANTNVEQEINGSNNGDIINNQQTTDSNNENLINRLGTGSNNRIHSTINTKLWKGLTINTKLETSMPSINSSVEIWTTINNNKYRTSVVINNTSIVNTVEIAAPE